jgi:hypothetical protein
MTVLCIPKARISLIFSLWYYYKYFVCFTTKDVTLPQSMWCAKRSAVRKLSVVDNSETDNFILSKS